MWYRIIVSAREVTDKRGLKTVHQTPVEYKKPTWIFGDPSISGSARGIGTETQAYGPGHYTAQSPGVSKGYKDDGYENRREERLPKGTRIIHFDALTPEEISLIITASNKKLGMNVDTNSKVRNLGEIGNLFFDSELIKIYPILVELGYDAVEHNVGRMSGGARIDANLEKLKSDPEYFTSKGNFKKRKYRKAVEKRDETNIIVINRAILTKPDLFQKIRLRPDSVSPEEIQEYKDEQQTTEIEYYETILKGGAKPKIDVLTASRLLDGGIDPNIIIDSIIFDQVDRYGFDIRFDIAKKLSKYFDDRIIFKIFTAREIHDNKEKLRSILKGVLGGESNAVGKAIKSVVLHDKLEQRLLSWCYDLEKVNCNEYGCGKQYENIYQKKCNKCGSDYRARFYKVKSNLPLSTITQGLELHKSLTNEDIKNQRDLAVYSIRDLYGQLDKYYVNIVNEIAALTSLDAFYDFYDQYKDIFNYFGIDKYSKIIQSLASMKAHLQSLETQNSNIQPAQQSQPEQPAPKVAYKILQKTAGKTKYYYFNGESKPLRDHIKDIFPYANSVDIFYMMDRLRRKAMSDDQVANLLYEAAMGRLFPRFEDKRA
jgi:hypothetical protein